jgi:hypothetical protein
MKYLKYFESVESEIENDKDNIIKVLFKYGEEYNDALTGEIDELIWESNEAGRRVDEVGSIDEECVRMMVNHILSFGWIKLKHKLLDIYYECSGILESEPKEDVIRDLKDIFQEYSDMGAKVEITKSSGKSNKIEYNVSIFNVEVLRKLDFSEILDRVEGITGIDNVLYKGGNDYIILTFYRTKEEEESEDVELPDLN